MKTDAWEKVDREKRYTSPEVRVYKTLYPSQRAVFAQELLARWGLVAAEPDGEDSAGRQKLKPLSVESLVTRACEMSQLAFEEFQKREWLLELPNPYEENM